MNIVTCLKAINALAFTPEAFEEGAKFFPSDSPLLFTAPGEKSKRSRQVIKFASGWGIGWRALQVARRRREISARKAKADMADIRKEEKMDRKRSSFCPTFGGEWEMPGRARAACG